MSDIPAGWAEFLAAPLGPEPLVECPFALLPFLVEHPPALEAPRTVPP